MRQTLLIVAALISAVAHRGADERHSFAERAAANDNRRPAGTLRDGVLTVHLEVRDVDWRPDGDDAPGIVVHAFAERGERARPNEEGASRPQR